MGVPGLPAFGRPLERGGGRRGDGARQRRVCARAVGGEILSLEGSAVGDEAVLVRGRFARLRADGSRLEDATASYLVVKVVGAAAVEWKVAVCLAMG